MKNKCDERYKGDSDTTKDKETLMFCPYKANKIHNDPSSSQKGEIATGVIVVATGGYGISTILLNQPI